MKLALSPRLVFFDVSFFGMSFFAKVRRHYTTAMS